MTKVVGEAKHIFVIEESDNRIDWTIVFDRKTEEGANLKYEQYKNECLAKYVRLMRFDRGSCLKTNERG